MKRWYAAGGVLLLLACVLCGVFVWRTVPRETAETTVREALAWLTRFGGRTAGEPVMINGVVYKVGHLLYDPERPDVADKPIAHVFDGYYHQLNFSV